MDETSLKIQNAMMELIMERGYSATTTKDIANFAGVNECTLFRKFEGKKDIVIQSMKQKRWHPDLQPEDFRNCTGDLEKDLTRFCKIYLSKVTPEFVKISIGLRSPELIDDTAKEIMSIPKTFKQGVKAYLDDLAARGKIKKENNTEALALMFLAINFGFIFFKASFDDKLSSTDEEVYILNSVRTFIGGIL